MKQIHITNYDTEHTLKLLLIFFSLFFTHISCMDMSVLPPEIKITIIAEHCNSLADCAAFIATCRKNAQNISIWNCLLRNPTSLLHPHYTEALVHCAQLFDCKNVLDVYSSLKTKWTVCQKNPESNALKTFKALIKAENENNKQERLSVLDLFDIKNHTIDNTIIAYHAKCFYIDNTFSLAYRNNNIAGIIVILLNYIGNTFRDEKERTHIMTAILEKKTLIIPTLLKYGKRSINAKDKYGNTALHHACLQNDIEIASQLLENGCIVNIPNNRHQTPLHIALSKTKQNMDLAELLVKHGADINMTTIRSGQPLLKTLSCDNQKLLTAAAQKRNQPDTERDNTDESATKRRKQ